MNVVFAIFYIVCAIVTAVGAGILIYQKKVKTWEIIVYIVFIVVWFMTAILFLK